MKFDEICYASDSECFFFDLATCVSCFRPFERIITLTKDSSGMTGFGFTDGKIVTIVKESSAARYLCKLWTGFVNFTHYVSNK